ncbi:hypothetical protein PTTG_03108 [Puccinia triticina 1-1 BBBD Race 1]|uniref:K Homology domain-containing protein n=1 Tax=Puccinia triticina (isolate 1-1 / race 1 (BBBD)) TaxID=630390 RepID=A0A180GQC1_PUCT1|nr:hypothetical protein PTTG_03108 [Puccinia triticina 1-1 BBBD Race 1]WAR61627.1 hypothetical protein PtB15_12B317 [Puccinia triticina]
MADFPSLESSAGTSKNAETHEPIREDAAAPLTSAEKLMRQHHQHLSYEEIRSATSNGDYDHQAGLPNGNGSGNPANQANKKNRDKKQQPDLDSETAFPSLGTSAAAPKTAGGWGAGPALSSRPLAGSFQKIDLSNTNQFTETLVLLLSSIHIGPVPPQYREKGPRAAGEKREEDPKTLPDVLRVIHKRHPTVIVESSTSRDRVTIIFRTPFVLPTPTSSTPPLIRAASSLAPEERIIRARQELITRVTRKIEKVLKIPASAKPLVIGQRGRVMKEIIEVTGANISLPPKDENRPVNVDPPSEETNINGSDEVEMITITINGEESSVLDAEDRIMMIVREHTNKVNIKITSIPVESYPLLNRKSKISEVVLRGLTSELGISEDEINCQLTIPSIDQIFKSYPSHLCLADPETNSSSHTIKASSAGKESLPITVSGDRQQVEYAVKVLESTFQNTIKSIAKVELELPKRQHKFLDKQAIEEILESTGSLVIVPPASDLSEKVVIRGENMSNVQALGLVVTKANALTVESLDLKKIHPTLSDPSGYSNSVIAHLSIKAHQAKLKQIQEECAPKEVKIYLPLQGSSFSTIDIAGKDAESIKHAKGLVETYIRNNMKPEYFVNVEVDRLLHRHILKKKNPRLKVLLDHNGIEMIIPHEQDPSSTILLVATKAIIGKEVKASNDSELTSALSKAKEEILKSVKELAEMKKVELEVPQKLHSHIVGHNQTTLNVIIGEDKLVSVQVGNPSSPDLITIRGSKDEVDRVEKEIRRMAEEAKVTEATNSYSAEFEIDSKLVSHLVGKGGATISKLGEELGVRVVFADQVSNGPSHETESSTHHKKRKNHHSKVLVTVSGRMENVEEAKKRILNQAERIADEVTVTLPIAAGLDRGALIGKGGIYLSRLQDTHMVHINMPRSRKEENSANGTDSDITIRGPKKGVEAVKRELIELMEYEREQGNVASIEISTKSVSRIVGKGGAQADKIKEDSGLQSLDIDRLDNAEGISRVTLKGSKAAISAAKKLINGIVQTVDDECFAEVKIPRSFHQSLIGRGGARLRELVKRAGLDESASKLVHFPRITSEGDAADIVQIKGDKNDVPKIKRELELEAERLINQVTYGAFIPKNSQPGIIGRGATGLKALQDKHNVTIIAPGWSQWATSDQPTNQADLKEVDPDEIFKVIGTKESCLSAIEDMKSKIVVKDRPERASASKKTMMIPAQFHHLLIQNGRFIRGLPRGVRIDHGNISIPSLEQIGKSSTDIPVVPTSRIDVDDSDSQNQLVILSWDAGEVKLNGMSEVPWNMSGPAAELENVEKTLKTQIDFWKSKMDVEGGKIYAATVKVPGHAMPMIIGRGGTGLRELTAKSDGAFVEVLGKSGSDTLKIMGTSKQLDSVKALLNQMKRRA